MECKEIRVDMRLMSPEERAFGAKMAQLMYQLNHTMPMTEEYNAVLKELFGDRIGAGSYVAAPIQGGENHYGNVLRSNALCGFCRTAA